jgi:hypothetical protein
MYGANQVLEPPPPPERIRFSSIEDLKSLKKWKETHKDKALISLHIMSHYLAEDKNTFKEEEWIDIYRAFIFMQNQERGALEELKKNDRFFELDVKKGLLELSFTFALSSVDPKKLAVSILDDLAFAHDEKIIWAFSENKAALVGGPFLIDLIRGSIFIDGVQVELAVNFCKQEPLYLHIFQERRIKQAYKKEALYCVLDDVYGELTIEGARNTSDGVQLTEKTQIFRQKGTVTYKLIEESWIQHALKEISISDYFLHAYTHWLSLDSQEIHFVSRTSGESEFIWNTSTCRVIQCRSPKRLLSNQETCPSLDAFLPRKWVNIFYNEDTGQQEMHFVRYQREDHTAIELEQQNHGLSLKGQKDFVLEQKERSEKFQGVAGVLTFFSQKKRKYLHLLPNLAVVPTPFTTKSCFAFKVLEEQPLNIFTCFSVEESLDGFLKASPLALLKLAEIFLKQHRYVDAYFVLNHISFVEKRNEDLRSAFSSFIRIDPQKDDVSGNSYAIKLHAFYLMKTIFPLAEGDLKIWLASYYENFKEIDCRLHLPPYKLEALSPSVSFKAHQKELRPKSAKASEESWNCNDAEFKKQFLYALRVPDTTKIPFLLKSNYPLHRLYTDFQKIASAKSQEEKRYLFYACCLYNHPYQASIDILRYAKSLSIETFGATAETWIETVFRPVRLFQASAEQTLVFEAQGESAVERGRLLEEKRRMTLSHNAFVQDVELSKEEGVHPEQLAAQFFQEKQKEPCADMQPLAFHVVEAPPLGVEAAVDAELKFWNEELSQGVRRNQSKVLYQLVQDKDVLLQEIKKAVEKIQQQEKALAKKIRALFRKEPEDKRQRAIYHAYQGGKKIQDKSLDEIIRLSCQGPEALMKENTLLSNKAAQEIQEVVCAFLVQKTLCLQYASALKKAEQLTSSTCLLEAEEPLIQEIAECLYQKRTYEPTVHNLPHLLFESFGLRVREQQKSIIDEMLRALHDPAKEEYSTLLFQLIMGGGKTSVILSLLMHVVSKQGKVPLFISHPSQIDTVRGNIEQFVKRHDLTLLEISFTKEELEDISILKHIQSLLERVKKEKDSVILMPDVTVHILGLLKEASWEQQDERYQLLEAILDCIKDECVSFLDEVHLTLDLKREVNFPHGEKRPLPKERIDQVKDLYLLLVEDPELREIFRFEENLQDQVVYNDSLKEKIVEKILERNIFDIGSSEDVKNYLLSRLEENSAFYQLFKKKGKEEKLIAKKTAFILGLLKSVLPVALGKSNNRGYGQCLGKKAGTIPFDGVGTPSNREIGSIFLQVCLDMQWVLNERVSEKHLINLCEEMYQVSSHLAYVKKILIEETEIAALFKTLTSVSLLEILAQDRSAIDQALEFINQTPRHKLLVAAQLAEYNVTGYKEYAASTAHDFIEHLGDVVACSGTISTRPTFHERFQKNGVTLMDAGALGSIVHKMGEKACKLHFVKGSKIAAVLASGSDQANLRGLIDVGGLFKEGTHTQTAQEIFSYFHGTKAVVFYSDITKGYAIMHKKGVITSLKNSSLEEIESKGFKLEDLFFYYDEGRTTGTDYPQLPTAMNIVTFDPKTTSLEKLTQGVLRLRQFFYKQTVELMCIEKAAVNTQLKEDLDYVLNKMAINGAIEKCHRVKEVHTSTGLRCRAKRDVRKKLKQGALFSSCKKALFTKITFDPRKMWGAPVSKEKPFQEHVKQMAALYGLSLEEALQMAQKASQDPFAPTLLTQVSKKGAENVALELAVQQEQEQQQEQAQVQEQELQRELDRHHHRGSIKPQVELPWSEEYINFLISGCWEAWSLRRELKKCVSFSENIWITMNCFEVCNHELSLFDKRMKQRHQFLLRKMEDGSLQALCISIQENEQFLSYMKKNKPADVWLMLPSGHLYMDCATPPPDNRELLNILIEVNFINGNVAFLMQYREETLAFMQNEGDIKEKEHHLSLMAIRNGQFKLLKKSPFWKISEKAALQSDSDTEEEEEIKFAPAQPSYVSDDEHKSEEYSEEDDVEPRADEPLSDLDEDPIPDHPTAEPAPTPAPTPLAPALVNHSWKYLLKERLLGVAGVFFMVPLMIVHLVKNIFLLIGAFCSRKYIKQRAQMFYKEEALLALAFVRIVSPPKYHLLRQRLLA